MERAVIPEIGNFSLILAGVSAFVCALSWACIPFTLKERWVKIVFSFTILQFLLNGCALLILIYSFAISDFTVLNVINNSHTSKPLIFKISGAWGNHEGSMLLWLCLLNFSSLLFLMFSSFDKIQKSKVLIVQSLISLGLISFIYFVSNPFERVFPAASEGLGLNPLLQDIGLAFHPPALYMGYVGFSLGFSIAVIALFNGSFTKECAKKMKPWIMFSWSFLTLGIALGSWWAYRELGWGGFWFWDPVENASLMPWLASTALLHSIIACQHRDILKQWSLLLAILTFCLCLLGTFLVRSGVLSSVHSFSVSPDRGVFILSLLTITAVGSLSIFALRAHKLSNSNNITLWSKEGMVLINNLILLVGCLTITLGTMYPLIYEFMEGSSISIGEPYYATTFIPLMLPLLIICSLGSLLSWKKGQLGPHVTNLAFSALISLAVVLITAPGGATSYIALFCGTFLFISMVLSLATKVQLFDFNLSNSFSRLRSLPFSYHTMFWAHIGFAIFIIAATAITTWQAEEMKVLGEGEQLILNDYRVTLKGLDIKKIDNYTAVIGDLYVEKGDNELTNLAPEIRFYPVEKTLTTESSIYSTLLYDLYAAIAEPVDGKVGVRLYFKPMVVWIWLSAIIMSLVGFVSFVHSLRRI